MGRADLKPCPRQYMVWPNTRYISIFSLKTSMLRNIDVFQTSNNTSEHEWIFRQFSSCFIHCYHFQRCKISRYNILGCIYGWIVSFRNSISKIWMTFPRADKLWKEGNFLPIISEIFQIFWNSCKTLLKGSFEITKNYD